MLSSSDNDILCRVGPGTPMGDLMREYWIPALMSTSSPRRTARRCACVCWARTSSPSARPPARWASSRTPARTAAPRCSSVATRRTACAASTTAGSSTSHGACVDMPSEPAESQLQEQGAHARLPVRRAQRHRSGPTWARARRRRRCRSSRPTSRTRRQRRAQVGARVQLHAGPRRRHRHDARRLPARRPRRAGRDHDAGSCDYYALKEKSAEVRRRRHEIGATYGAYRPAEDDTDYWRIAHFLLPFYTMNPTRPAGHAQSASIAWVPIDDENTMVWVIGQLRQPATTNETRHRRPQARSQ